MVPDLPIPTGFFFLGLAEVGHEGHSALLGTTSEKLEGSRTTEAGLDLFGSINRILPSALFEKPRKRREAGKVWYCK